MEMEYILKTLASRPNQLFVIASGVALSGAIVDGLFC